jgi:hypothetical protein
VHEVRLDLHRRAVGKLAELDLLVAVRRPEEGQLRAARGDVCLRLTFSPITSS